MMRGRGFEDGSVLYRLGEGVTKTERTLGGIPLFRTLTKADLDRLETTCIWREYAAGQWVIDHEGDGTDIFVVLRGHLRVVTATGGRETILRDLHDGEYFGELAALDSRPRSAGVLAVTTSTLACMPAATLRGAIHDHPDVCDQILATLVGQIRMLANRANETAGLSARQRMWAEMLRLAGSKRATLGNAILSPPPTHAELAARIGSHREAVTRELNAMERSGLIARRRGAIELLDTTRLRRMVDEAGAR